MATDDIIGRLRKCGGKKIDLISFLPDTVS